MLANIKQSHLKVFNWVLNGITSRSLNSITHTHTRTRSTLSSSTAEDFFLGGGHKEEVSQPLWKPERQSGSKALEEVV